MDSTTCLALPDEVCHYNLSIDIVTPVTHQAVTKLARSNGVLTETLKHDQMRLVRGQVPRIHVWFVEVARLILA